MVTFKDRHGPVEVSDIDLDKEEFVYHGERLTEERAEEIAAEALAAVKQSNLVPGGKSLSGGGKTSPVVQFRVPEDLRGLLIERADAEGVTPSRLARRALEKYLNETAGAVAVEEKPKPVKRAAARRRT